MSKLKRPKSAKPSAEKVILVDRQAFLSAMELSGRVLEALGDEVVNLQILANEDPSGYRIAMLEQSIAHLRFTESVIGSFQESLYDPIDPDDSKGRLIN